MTESVTISEAIFVRFQLTTYNTGTCPEVHTMTTNNAALQLMIEASIVAGGGDVERAEALMDRAIEIARNSGSEELAAQWTLRRSLLRPTNRPGQAIQGALANLLEIQREGGDLVGQIDTLINLGAYSIQAGDLAGAKGFLDQAHTSVASLEVAPRERDNRTLSELKMSTQEFIDLRTAEINRLLHVVSENGF